jgi:hypothetical protein
MQSQTALDPIRRANAACLGYIDAYQPALHAKRILSKSGLVQTIKFDLDKLTRALQEVGARPADNLAREFFAEAPELLPEILSLLRHNRIYHLGFEIHEPMEIMRVGLRHWVKRTRADWGMDMEIREMRCFRASQALQQRLGAPVEIMRLRLQVGERPLMLELFDVQGPVDVALLAQANRMRRMRLHGLFTPGASQAALELPLSQIFAGDRLWHYALHVEAPADIHRMHRCLQDLAARNAHYRRPYPIPVENRHEGSLHTKIINQARRLELEFVTEL